MDQVRVFIGERSNLKFLRSIIQISIYIGERSNFKRFFFKFNLIYFLKRKKRNLFSFHFSVTSEDSTTSLLDIHSRTYYIRFCCRLHLQWPVNCARQFCFDLSLCWVHSISHFTLRLPYNDTYTLEIQN